MKLKRKTVYHVPDYYQAESGGLYVLVDTEAPNWIATDECGARIVGLLKANSTLDEVVLRYAALCAVGPAKAWLHVDSFIKALLRCRFASPAPFARPMYRSRSDFLRPDRLNELWIHTSNSCNLNCAHCLVNSSPSGHKGLTTSKLKAIMDQGAALGVRRFYFTGGEPLVRDDIVELVRYATEDKDAELVILTNGTLLCDNKRDLLANTNRERVKLQVSLDGSQPSVNDPIRGERCFERAVAGVRYAVEKGFIPTVTTAVMPQNADDITDISRLTAKLGARDHHLMWLHRRGRAVANSGNVPADRLARVARTARRHATESGISIDNYVSLGTRVNGPSHVKYDLGNACYDSVCVYSDGGVYPSASFAGRKELLCGNINGHSLEEIWQESPICEEFRQATVQNKMQCSSCHLKFLCGGGDIEHSYFHSLGTIGRPSILGIDPYCELHQEMISEIIFSLGAEKRRAFNSRSGFDAPIVYQAMGEDATCCGEEESAGEIPVRTVRSNCVLSLGREESREAVRSFYGKAAEEPQEYLCCPTQQNAADTSHIPKEVLERFYGCGSPVDAADVQEGETVMDLGSGGGIDCFVAAKMVGPNGHVIGIDMTDQMLEVANQNNPKVAADLGFDVVEFRKGYLEEIPAENASVDLITSNCVINLSPDKRAVFREMWRVLKDNGRIVVADIVSETRIPSHLKANQQLWGECLGGALTEEEFISFLEQAGFYGIQTLRRAHWKDVEGYRFYSVTTRAYKYEKKADCVYAGQTATYHGPFKAVMDEEGHLFPRDEAVEVCTDTASKLQQPPYRGLFAVSDPPREAEDGFSCCDDSSCCAP